MRSIKHLLIGVIPMALLMGAVMVVVTPRAEEAEATFSGSYSSKSRSYGSGCNVPPT